MTWDTPRRCIARQILISRLCHLACLEEVFRPRSLSSPLNSPSDVISWENLSMILTCVRLLPRDRSYRSFEPLELSKLKGVLFRQWQTTKRLSTMNYWSQTMWNISLGTSLSLLLTTDLRRVSNRNWNKTSIGCFFSQVIQRPQSLDLHLYLNTSEKVKFHPRSTLHEENSIGTHDDLQKRLVGFVSIVALSSTIPTESTEHATSRPKFGLSTKQHHRAADFGMLESDRKKEHTSVLLLSRQVFQRRWWIYRRGRTEFRIGRQWRRIQHEEQTAEIQSESDSK